MQQVPGQTPRSATSNAAAAVGVHVFIGKGGDKLSRITQPWS